MRIAVINQHPLDALGGSEIQCDLIAQELTKLGHKVTYFAVSAKKTSYPVSYPVEPLPRFGLFALFRALRRHRIEVVYWRHNKKGLFKAALAAKLAGAKFIYALSSISDSRPWVNFGSRPLERFLAAWKAAGRGQIFRPSLLMLTLDPLYSAANFLAVPLLANGVTSLSSDLIHHVPVTRKTVLRNSMSISALPFRWQRPFVIWVANIKPKKNPEAFVALAESLRELPVDFLMVGKIQDSRYAYLTDASRIPSNLFYLGPKSPEEVNGIIRESQLLVHTCNPEGFGNNFIQAWLQGKPTVSLYFDPDRLISSQGIGFHSRTPENFVSQVSLLLCDANLRGAMGDKAQRFAKENFTPEANIPKLEAFLRSVL